jgi:hypothetical protein
MSEPVTHAEIEDVLTSIRRLVRINTDARPSEDGSSARRLSVRNNGRLVLTPALRVMPRAEVGGDGVVTEVSPSPIEDLKADFIRETQPEPPEIPAHQNLQDQHAELSEAASRPDFVDETSSKEMLRRFEATADPETGARQAHDDVRPAADVVADTPSEPSTDATDRTPGMAEQASERVSTTPKSLQCEAPWRDPSATLYAAALRQSAVKDAPELASLPDRPAASARVAAVVRRISEIETAHQAGEAVPGGAHWTQTQNEDDTGALPTTSVEVADWDDTRASEMADIPAAEGNNPDAVQVEPQEMSKPPVAPPVETTPKAPTQVVPDTASAVLSTAALEVVQGQVREQLNEAVEAAVQNALPTFPSSGQVPVDDALMDEGALRELVAETVRQELQGALGERITRNVRKLVRREIQRALNSQELF